MLSNIICNFVRLEFYSPGLCSSLINVDFIGLYFRSSFPKIQFKEILNVIAYLSIPKLYISKLKNMSSELNNVIDYLVNFSKPLPTYIARIQRNYSGT